MHALKGPTFNVFFLLWPVEKMKMIDQEYENFSYSGGRWFSFQSKLSAYRKEIEAQSQEEMNTKVCFLQSYGTKSAIHHSCILDVRC